MSNENCDKVVEECKGYLKEFEVCGLKEEVLRRISELVQWLEKQKAEGKRVGGFGIICIDIRRAVELAKTYDKDECEYFRRWLSKPFTEKGGLGYFTYVMSQ